MDTPNFKRVIHGYDPEAVDQAWGDIDRQFTKANAANKELRLKINSLRDQNSELENSLQHYKQIEIDLRDALLSAQRIANQVKKEASNQANELIQSARLESEKLIAEATRLSESRKYETETFLNEKKIELSQLKDQIQKLSEKKDGLQTLVDQAIQYLKNTTQLLGPSIDFSKNSKNVPPKPSEDSIIKLATSNG